MLLEMRRQMGRNGAGIEELPKVTNELSAVAPVLPNSKAGVAELAERHVIKKEAARRTWQSGHEPWKLALRRVPNAVRSHELDALGRPLLDRKSTRLNSSHLG